MNRNDISAKLLIRGYSNEAEQLYWDLFPCVGSLSDE